MRFRGRSLFILNNMPIRNLVHWMLIYIYIYIYVTTFFSKVENVYTKFWNKASRSYARLLSKHQHPIARISKATINTLINILV